MSRSLVETAATAEPTSAAELTDIGPGSTVTCLDEQELAVLRQVGGHWGMAHERMRKPVRVGDPFVGRPLVGGLRPEAMLAVLCAGREPRSASRSRSRWRLICAWTQAGQVDVDGH
jgi:hypothetical protein